MGLQILHWHLAVRTFLNVHLPNTWIYRAGQNYQVFCNWPPRSPDLTVCEFFSFWGYVKDRVYVLPLPANGDELQERISSTYVRGVSFIKPKDHTKQINTHGYHSNATTPKLQHISNQEQYDQCGNSTE